MLLIAAIEIKWVSKYGLKAFDMDLSNYNYFRAWLPRDFGCAAIEDTRYSDAEFIQKELERIPYDFKSKAMQKYSRCFEQMALERGVQFARTSCNTWLLGLYEELTKKGNLEYEVKT